MHLPHLGNMTGSGGKGTTLLRKLERSAAELGATFRQSGARAMAGNPRMRDRLECTTL